VIIPPPFELQKVVDGIAIPFFFDTLKLNSLKVS
jgi:hypothetical protein